MGVFLLEKGPNNYVFCFNTVPHLGQRNTPITLIDVMGPNADA